MRNLLILGSLIIFTGCTIKEPVYVPVKCEIEKPKRPKPVRGAAFNVKQIIEYTEKLEYNLEFCIEGKVNEKN